MLAVLLVSVLCIPLFFVSSAASSVEATTGSITVTLLDSAQKPLSNTVFRLYRFASALADGDGLAFAYTEEFAHNGMSPGNFSDSYLPVHLATYAALKNIPYTEKATNEKGTVVFDNLSLGAYLVVPAGVEQGYLNPSPFIVTVPMKDASGNQWVTDIDATPKVEDDRGEHEEKTYISVKKEWKTTEDRPDSITVALIKDGAVADTVELNAANNWRHRWNDLDKNHAWSVVETDVPSGYTVTYETSEMTVLIINTQDDYEEPPSTPPEDPTDPDEPPDDELIDTGQLNWPVPVFATAGLLLFSAGWAMLNLGKKDEEEA